MVAVKEIPLNSLTPKTSTMLVREIETLRRVSSPYIVSLHSTFQTAASYCLVMEYCPGSTLSQCLHSHTQLAEETLQRWSMQLLLALKEMRARSVIHRDLKLDNIMLTHTDPSIADLKVCDFGLARILEDDDLAETMVGTPMYAAPEVLLGDAYGAKVDLWSFGAVLFEMAVGRKPFAANSLRELKEMQKKTIDFSGVSVPFRAKALILDLLEYDPANRPDIEEIESHIFFSTLEQQSINIDEGSIGMGPYTTDVTPEQIRDVGMTYEHSNECVHRVMLERALLGLKRVRSIANKVDFHGSGERKMHISMLLGKNAEIEAEITRKLDKFSSKIGFQRKILVEEAENVLISVIRKKIDEEKGLKMAEVLLATADERNIRAETAMAAVAHLRSNRRKREDER